ncbi:DUF3515 family protein [Georgenia yuyongxinii]|uniref:DUF3515 family protein n=1 Tax=Georgenia yuyongxinii TaxID=2589797 RepID=UPI001E4E6920|nr:DUF3515 family protein [Georgenia yuyongxinii]
MPLARARRRPRALVALFAVTLAGVLAGCGSPVEVPPGEAASDPTCARVLQATPDELGGLERRSTTAQATTAWGANPAVTVRCGVLPPAPTTDRCLSVEQPDGTAVDWIQLESDDESFPDRARDTQGSWAFVTYGRVPAIEVVVTAAHVTGQPTAFLVDLASAAQISPAERFCVGADDVR